MIFRTDEDVLKACDELDDEAAVEARLKTGHFSDNPTPAWEWLIRRRNVSEQRRWQREIKNSQLTAWASLALAIGTLILVGITLWGINSQNRDSRELREQAKEQLKEQLEQQRKDSQAKRDDAKALLEFQILNEYDKQFDSLEMREARRRLAKQLLNHKEVTEDRVADFFDELAMLTHQGRIDQDTVYDSYSYNIERYWLALKTSVEDFRKQENDPSYYTDFEELYQEMLSADAEDRDKSVDQVIPSKSEVHKFLLEEVTLPR